MFLIRSWEWWYSKVPLSITTVLMLLDGRQLSFAALAVVVLVVLAVCAVGNFGYAINELFDVEEDARLGRANVAASRPAWQMWAIVLASALSAEVCTSVAAGVLGTLLTSLALALPLAYSVPPVRVKERKWLGVAADALAAHVFPAILALLAVSHLILRPVAGALAIAIVVWAAATGVRGILSHQLQTAEQDRVAGLMTVAHRHGNARLERFVVGLVLPIEVIAFGTALVLCNGGIVLWSFVALYVALEIVKTFDGRLRVTVFRSGGQPFVPFVDEAFYKAWGPLVLAIDAARVDLRYLVVIPAYAVLFAPHMRIERDRFRALAATLRISRAKEPADRSNEGS